LCIQGRIVFDDRGCEKNTTTPLFPFGFELSCTSFKFSNLKVTQGAADSTATVTFDLKHAGSRERAELAQVYVPENKPVLERPKHQLKGFERVNLKPGETKHLSINLDERSFSYYDTQAKALAIGSTDFTISVGDSVATLPLKAELRLKKGAR